MASTERYSSHEKEWLPLQVIASAEEKSSNAKKWFSLKEMASFKRDRLKLDL